MLLLHYETGLRELLWRTAEECLLSLAVACSTAGYLPIRDFSSVCEAAVSSWIASFNRSCLVIAAQGAECPCAFELGLLSTVSKKLLKSGKYRLTSCSVNLAFSNPHTWPIPVKGAHECLIVSWREFLSFFPFSSTLYSFFFFFFFFFFSFFLLPPSFMGSALQVYEILSRSMPIDWLIGSH